MGIKRVSVEPGEKYNLLTVIKQAEDKINKDGSHYKAYRCLCDCGKETVVTIYDLISGHTKSCGHIRYNSQHRTKDLTGLREIQPPPKGATFPHSKIFL